jgi:hypothetical protein
LLTDLYLDFTYRLESITRRVRFLHRDLKSAQRGALPWRRRAWLLSHGFLSESDSLYHLEKNDPRDYVSDYARFHRANLNRWPHLFNDKLCFYWLLRDLGFPTPRIFATVEKGRAVGLGPHADAPDLETILRRVGMCVLKLRDGTNGRGVTFVEALPDGMFRVNGAIQNTEALRQRIGDASMLVSERMTQHEYAARIAPGSVNTFRLMTFTDADTGEAFVGRAVHRFGTKRSGVVDNASVGGLCAHIDIATGTIGEAEGVRSIYGDARLRTHPDTGIAFVGVEIPRWREVIDTVTRLANRLPENPYIGWDVLITPESFTIIEGNATPDVNLVQVHGPLLTDPRIRRFYERYNVVRP